METSRFVLALFATPVADVVELDLPNGQTKLVDNNQLARNGVIVDRQIINIGDPANANNLLSIGTDGAIASSDGGTAGYYRINNSSQTVNVVKAAPGRVCRVWCVDATAPSGITVSIYDDPNGNTNNKLWSGQLAVDEILNLQCPTANGITVIVSSAPASGQDILVSYN